MADGKQPNQQLHIQLETAKTGQSRKQASFCRCFTQFSVSGKLLILGLLVR